MISRRLKNVLKEPFDHTWYVMSLVALAVLFNNYLYQQEVIVPFYAFANSFEDVWVNMNTCLIIAGTFLVVTKRAMRFGAALIAIALLLNILGCRPCYSDSRFFNFSLFFLTMVTPQKHRLRLLQIQVALLYFGSGLNKALDVDWWNGSYIENLMVNKKESSMYLSIKDFIPAYYLSYVISVTTILIELFMGLSFFFKKYIHVAIWLGILLHVGSILFLNTVFGSFILCTFISYLFFVKEENIMSGRELIDFDKSQLKRFFIHHPFGHMIIIFGFVLFNDSNPVLIGWSILIIALLYTPYVFGKSKISE